MSNLLHTIEQLKQQQAHLYDPVSFCFIESMAQRMAEKSPRTQTVIEKKLQEAVNRYQSRYEQSTATSLLEKESSIEKNSAHATQQNTIAALKALRNTIEHTHNNDSDDSTAIDHFAKQLEQQTQALSQQANTSHQQPTSQSQRQLKASSAYQQLQQQQYIDHFLDTAFNETPENPGPLNPEILAIGLLKNINGLSNEYINRYVSYFETLQWLQQEVRPSKSASK